MLKKLCKKLELIHPTRETTYPDQKEHYSCCAACCVDPGSNFCYKTDENSRGLDDFGPGVVLYFRHMKSTIWFILACSIISTVLVYLYNEAYLASVKGANRTLEGAGFAVALQDYSLSTSLGGFSYGSSRFFESGFTDISHLNSTSNDVISKDKNKIKLDCINGIVDINREYTYYGLIDQKFSSSYTFFMFFKEANLNENFYEALNVCSNKTSCELQYSSTWFDTAVANRYIRGDQDVQPHKLYLKYHCKDIKLEYFGGEFDKPSLNYLIIVISVLLLIFLIIYLINWNSFEKKIFSNFQETYPLPSDYTIKIKNLPQGMTEETLKERLFDHFESFKEKLKIRTDFIMDINIAKGDDVIYLDQSIKRYELKLGAILEAMVELKLFPDGDQFEVKRVIDYRNKNKSKFATGKAAALIKKFERNVKKKQSAELRRNKISEQKQEFLSVFITFNKNVNKVKVYNAMHLSKAQRLAIKCCCANSKGLNNFESKLLRVKNPSEPSNILWKNLQISPFEKRVRRTISLVGTIILVAIPVVIVILISISMTQQEPLKLSCPSQSVFSTENMKKDPSIKQKVLEDHAAGDRSENLMFCYCYAEFSARYKE